MKKRESILVNKQQLEEDTWYLKSFFEGLAHGLDKQDEPVFQRAIATFDRILVNINDEEDKKKSK